MAITYRIVKGSALTYAELDDNFTTLVASVASANALAFSLDAELSLLQAEVSSLAAAAFSVKTFLTTVSVGAVDGTATLVPAHTAAGAMVLRILADVAPTDIYDLEIYDGAVVGGTLLYQVLLVTGDHKINQVFFEPLVSSQITVKVVNHRGDSAPFSLALTVNLVWT